MKRNQPNHYVVLGVAPTATAAEISHAYGTLLRAHHPDTRTNSGTGAANSDAELQKVITAYSVLRDPVSRANYDREAALPVTRSRASPRSTARRSPIVAGP